MIQNVQRIRCDTIGCEAVYRDQFDGASWARRHAQSEGWARIKIDGQMLDLCPACTQRRQDGHGEHEA